MLRYLTGALSLSVLLAFPAKATTFSVLLDPKNPETTCDVPADPTSPSNSVRPTRMRVGGTAQWLIRPMRLTIDFDPVIPQGSPNLPAESFVFGLTLVDPETGLPITQFSEPVTVGFDTPFSESVARNHCLAYLDETKSPPEWKCQDPALVQVNGSFWCGQTDHFTVFALAETSAVPEPASATLMSVALITLMQRLRPGNGPVRT